ncbi:hypothetical protein UY3_13478 [Chelonia mydas]|uniref:Uncharacterized protein n=1 Tax=Chelonia mydas TaxID=8469 RepID=M7AVB2_CHEMY|nr:hypothetical protein UY3_13478 [Chelonia mydas]
MPECSGGRYPSVLSFLLLRSDFSVSIQPYRTDESRVTGQPGYSTAAEFVTDSTSGPNTALQILTNCFPQNPVDLILGVGLSDEPPPVLSLVAPDYTGPFLPRGPAELRPWPHEEMSSDTTFPAKVCLTTVTVGMAGSAPSPIKRNNTMDSCDPTARCELLGSRPALQNTVVFNYG